MKKVLIWIVAILLIVDAVIVFLVLNKSNGWISLPGSESEKDVTEKEYRIVKVNSFDGDVTLVRDKEEEEVFEDMRLIPKDDCTVGSGAQLELLVDEDKHIVASENTEFKINAKGDSNKGSVKIELVKGEALFTIDNKLSEKDSFEVETSNAVLSVRGTEFRVIYDEAEGSTNVAVLEGTVWLTAANGEEIVLEAGDTVTVFDDRVATYVSDEKFEELMAKISDLDAKREEAINAVADYENASSNYLNNEEIADALGVVQNMRDSEIPSLFQDRLPSGDIIQEEISESEAVEYIAVIDEAIAKYDELEQLAKDSITVVDTYVAENGWREAYKAFIADPSSVITNPIYKDTYGFANFAGDAYPEIIIWGDTSKSGNGRYGSVYFVSYSEDTGMYVLADTGCEINTGFAALDGKLLMRTIENGPATYTVYSYTVTQGKVKSNGKVASGKATNLSWPAGSQEIEFYKTSDTSPIDSYELTDTAGAEQSDNGVNDDASNNGYSISDVVGTWEDPTHYVTVAYTFNEDGTGYSSDLPSDIFTYTVEGDKVVYTKTGKGRSYTYTFTIVNGKLKDSAATYSKI